MAGVSGGGALSAQRMEQLGEPAPVGTCANHGFMAAFIQQMAIAWGQNRYPIRTQTITTTSQGITPGEGTINNSYNDISATFP